jgi:hypothetical protein
MMREVSLFSSAHAPKKTKNWQCKRSSAIREKPARKQDPYTFSLIVRTVARAKARISKKGNSYEKPFAN